MCLGLLCIGGRLRRRDPFGGIPPAKDPGVPPSTPAQAQSCLSRAGARPRPPVLEILDS